jgi:hypothetical protein
MCNQYFRAIFALLLIFHLSSSFADENKQLDRQQALMLLYGGDIWTSDKLKEYFNGQDRGYISVAFEAPYVEQGQNKYVVIVRITPKPAEEYACHACTPIIGGGVFKLSGTDWAVESKGDIVGWGGTFGEKFSLVNIGLDKHGILDSIEDSHGGYEDKSIKLIIPYNGYFHNALNIGFGEKPGPGACGHVPKQYVAVHFLQAKSEFFDVESKLKFNDGTCKKFSVRNQIARYRFSDGIYKRLGK